MNSLGLQAFFDPATYTLTYVVWDTASRDAVVIDPVLNYEPSRQMTSLQSMRALIGFLNSKNLRVGWVLETHAHADHLSCARELKAVHPGMLWGMGARIGEVFRTFQKAFNWPSALGIRDLGLDRFFSDGEEFSAGRLRIQALATPGHTPACVTYRIGTWLFTGDALMMPDSGVGRCDFPGGSAAALWDSIWGKLYSLSGDLETFPGHDYQPGGRPLRYRAKLSVQRRCNLHLREDTAKAEFVAFRESRDRTLTAPRLLQPSLDWNLGAHQIVAR